MPNVIKNDRFLRALLCQPVDCTPIWIMRQAGRYLPEYRATREKAGDFMTLCKTPELACEVTLQPINRFNLDAAILFSDILTIPDAMGLGLYFTEGEGPKFRHPISRAEEIVALSAPDPEISLGYVSSAIRLIKRELDNRIPLIGFSGSPWTLACYMIEGGASKTFSIIKKMLFQNPQELSALIEILIQSVTAYLNAQIAAGVNAVMIFDTWGGILTTSAYQQFSLNPMAKIIAGLNKNENNEKIPVILFTKNSAQWLAHIAQTTCNAIGIDWMIDLKHAREIISQNSNGQKIALQGNMDPAVLYSNPEFIRNEVRTILNSYGPGPGHIFNLGHGITPDIPPEHVGILVDAVHELSLQKGN